MIRENVKLPGTNKSKSDLQRFTALSTVTDKFDIIVNGFDNFLVSSFEELTMHCPDTPSGGEQTNI